MAYADCHSALETAQRLERVYGAEEAERRSRAYLHQHVAGSTTRAFWARVAGLLAEFRAEIEEIAA